MTPTVCLSSPVDMLSAVPYMLGFHPTDSIVVLGLRDDALVFQLRGDLPKPHEVRDFATYYARVVQRQQVDAAMLAGYGEAASVTPVVFATARALVRRRITVVEAVRAHRGRFWSYLCGSPRCCPPEGKPYDVSSSRVAAQATVSGYVALPSRSDLERRLAPLSGPPRTAMRAATARAVERLVELVGTRPGQELDALLPVGRAAVDAALARRRAGGRLDDEEVAWLSVLLGSTPVRDHAWCAVGGDLTVHVSLWTDVVRRAEPDLAAPPATLLGFAAWRAGEGAIATIALARALRSDPDYRMARLLDHALRHGLSPTDWVTDDAEERPCTRAAPA